MRKLSHCILEQMICFRMEICYYCEIELLKENRKGGEKSNLGLISLAWTCN